jgi:hypothetical protein
MGMGICIYICIGNCMGMGICIGKCMGMGICIYIAIAIVIVIIGNLFGS